MNTYNLFAVLFSLLCTTAHGASHQNQPFPIQFSISETKIVTEVPQKDKDFAHIIPGNLSTYIFNTETDYYQDYQRAYFAITCKKGGWDCLRHYEILANGCIPYFVDIDQCPENTMAFLPKELIKEAMNLEGVSYLHIDHTKFNKEKYFEILEKLLEHTRNYLTSRAMAHYVLDTVHYKGNGQILYLSLNNKPDYLKSCTLIGLKQAFGNNIIDVPQIDHICTNFGDAQKAAKLYGKGFTYSRVIDDIEVDRNNIEERIKNKEFDIIIYAEAHRGTPLHALVQQTYEPERIIYFCGEDSHRCEYSRYTNLFLRESAAYVPAS